jgi:hypothetical protein
MSGAQGLTRLVVFSDDWGRHPSSCQHLIRRLLPRYPTIWVNTIGTRRPGLSAGDLRKIGAKLRQWFSPPAQDHADLPGNLTVLSPRMWPGFGRPWQRKLNRRMIANAVNAQLGPRQAGERRVAITTLPITADLVGALAVDRWTYYCVDDFAVWPGMDGPLMQSMERELAAKVDAAVAAAPVLAERLSAMGRPASVLTHGIDLEHWGFAQSSPPSSGTPANHPKQPLPAWWSWLNRPIFLFWGLIDRRLDVTWCKALMEGQADNDCASRGRGTLLLVGPEQDSDPALQQIPGLVMPGPVDYDLLPGLAVEADVLVMPYADLPVTQAMQPLKFKEYLATGKPVVVRDLPATQCWSDAADVVDSAANFVAVSRQRADSGTPAGQVAARARLADESWERKAAVFEETILGSMA